MRDIIHVEVVNFKKKNSKLRSFRVILNPSETNDSSASSICELQVPPSAKEQLREYKVALSS